MSSFDMTDILQITIQYMVGGGIINSSLKNSQIWNSFLSSKFHFLKGQHIGSHQLLCKVKAFLLSFLKDKMFSCFRSGLNEFFFLI